MQDINRKPDGERLDPGHFERMLELELMQKRAAWQQARAKRGIVRALAYLFLFLIISAGVLAYFLSSLTRVGGAVCAPELQRG